MQVFNTKAVKAEVKVNTPNGPDFVHIQPKGRVTLDADHTVDKNWLALNGQGIRLVADQSAETVTAQPAASTLSKSTKLTASGTTNPEE